MAVEALHTGSSAAPSRRRGKVLEQAIFDAVVEQLATVGYAGLTMDAVAATARTSKAAIYRRWSNKAELVVDALDNALPSPDELPERDSVREELIELLREKADVLNSQVGRAVQSLLAEIDRDRPFMRLVDERVFAPRQDVFRRILERGVARGEVRKGSVSPLVAGIGPAMLVQRFLGDPSPVPHDLLVAVVDDLILPLIRP
ncbi:TetR/AcrR family transcriptional regulator [Streptomyces sp. NBC_01485]|uniref:TetR/AcrR family transcriptional regulator n=1 Tax=Streptomyces sp. NBC_01485 TaxID=2903884 RepID=UPI002E316CEC|nr:TetR/AcrR family transcriptional regulator [Streptomyces sp. NBC_01485]